MLDTEPLVQVEDLIMDHNLLRDQQNMVPIVITKKQNVSHSLIEEGQVILGNHTQPHRQKVVVVVLVTKPLLLHVLVREGLENKDIPQKVSSENVLSMEPQNKIIVTLSLSKGYR
jgi:hypothetical protein